MELLPDLGRYGGMWLDGSESKQQLEASFIFKNFKFKCVVGLANK